jgi:hypothetical protein
MKVLKSDNSKLGKQIYSINLPRLTCEKYRTAICDRCCYAKKAGFTMPNTQKHMRENYELSLNSYEFIKEISKELIHIMKKLDHIYIRLHPCGDFYSQQYYESWNTIAQSFPKIHFLAFTRNWEIDFGKHADNLKIYYSVDDSTDFINESLEQFAILLPKDIWNPPTQHMLKIPHEYGPSRLCNSKCHDCKACWFHNGNIAFNHRFQKRGQGSTMPKYAEFRRKLLIKTLPAE